MGIRSFVFAGVAMALAATLPAAENRITEKIDGARTVSLAGHVKARATEGTDLGAVGGTFQLNDLVLTLRPSDEQQAQLETYLADLQDPASASFRHWLTPEQFAERFGPSQADVDKITAWLEAQGFRIAHVAGSRNMIAFTGTGDAARQAFGSDIHRVTAGNESHFATLTEPHVPAAIAGLVAGLRGLDDFHPQRPSTRALPAYTSGSGRHYLAPDDVATIYNIASLYSKGIDGTGQNIAVVGQSGVNLADMAAFRSIFNLSANAPNLVTVPNLPVPGIVSGDVLEADLDLEWTAAVARNATINYVYTNDAFTAIQYAVTQNIAPVISISYGSCETGSEASVLRSIAQQAAAQGITLIASSGDSGAFSCETGTSGTATHAISVSLPASVPEVTAVGGTEFNEGSGTYWNSSNGTNLGSATGYIPEAAWNETSTGQLSASGGGASAQFAKPVWQTGTGVPADGARDVPDIAMAAAASHDGALICTSGGCASGISGISVVGGTSLAAPLFAGITALLNQYEVQAGVLSKAGFGNMNPTLYAVAQNYGDAFHDITTGNTNVPCRTTITGCSSGTFGYAAGPGYDMATGLGTVSATALAADIGLLKSAPPSLSSVAVSPSSLVGGGPAVVTVTLTGVAPAGGTSVSLSSNNTAFPVPATLTVAAGQFTATATVTTTAVTSSTPVTLAAVLGSVTKTASISLAPIPPITLSALGISPTSVSSNGTATVVVTLSAAAPAGGTTVSLSSSNGSAFPVPASISVATGQTSGKASVTAGTVTASTSVTVTATLGSSSQTASVTVAPVVLPNLSAVAISPQTITGGGSAIVSVSLASVAPTGGAVVALASTSTAFPAPASITIPAGQRQAAATVQTQTVNTQTTATVTATFNGSSQTATVTITPAVSVSLSSVAITPTLVTGGQNALVAIALTGPAPSGGISVTMTSSSTALPLPATLSVPAGRQEASVTVQTNTVTSATAVNVTAAYNGVSKGATATINPVASATLSGVFISPSSLSAGQNALLAVALAGPAPSGGAVVTLSSSNAALPVPANITIPAGAQSGSVSVQAGSVTASTSVTVTASYGGTTMTASATVAPVTLPGLVGIAILPSSVTGGQSALLVVSLSDEAPAGGATVALSSASSAFPVPASITIPAGHDGASLAIQTASVTAETSVTVTATYNGGTQKASVTVNPAAALVLNSLMITPSAISAGQSATVYVSLSGPAPSTGASVSLSSSSTAFPVPASIAIPAGRQDASVQVQSSLTNSSTAPVAVTASFGGVSKSASLTITPGATATLAGVSISPSSLVGGQTAFLTVTLAGPAPSAGTTVALSSSNSAFPVPATVAISAGQNQGSISVQTTSVTSTVTATVSATLSGSTKTAAVTLTPVQLPALSSVSISPSSVTGGQTATLTISLSDNAPSGGATVTLSSNSSAFPVPSSVTIPAGRDGGFITVQTSAVTASTPVSVTATYNGVSKVGNATIVAAPTATLTTVTITPSSITAGQSAYVIVDLNVAAPSSGAVVSLSSSSSAFPVPTSVTIPAGHTEAYVSVQSASVTATTTATVTASLAGSSQTATVTIAPLVLPTLTSVQSSSGNGVGDSSAAFSVVTVQLSTAAPAGGAVVSLSSNNAAFPVPSTISIPGGASQGVTFVQPKAVTVSTTVTVTATYNGGSKTATTTLAPVVVPTLTGLIATPTSVKGGSSVTLTFTLSSAPPASGSEISLSSNNAAIAVPSTVTLVGGTSGSMRVQTGPVKASTPVQITAAAGGVSQSVTITVTP